MPEGPITGPTPGPLLSGEQADNDPASSNIPVVISMFYTPNQYIGAKGDFGKGEDFADLDTIRLIEIIVKIFER